jgi:hypothetical protein
MIWSLGFEILLLKSDIAAIRHKKRKNQILGLVISMYYNEQPLNFKLVMNPSNLNADTRHLHFFQHVVG